MAPFFMKKYWKEYTLAAFTLICAQINNQYLWGALILGILLYFVLEKHRVEATFDAKDKAMGLRLIDGMRALTELCKNAFDHIKTTNGKVEKLGAKVGETMAKVHRLEQRGNVKTTPKTPFPPESWKKPEVSVPVKKEKKEKTKE